MAGRCRSRVGLRPEEEEGADMWGPVSVRERGEARTDSGYNPGGLWAGSMAGPNRIPVAFFLFFFPIFSFLFYLLQKYFN
jgi:hypothetical protein